MQKSSIYSALIAAGFLLGSAQLATAQNSDKAPDPTPPGEPVGAVNPPIDSGGERLLPRQASDPAPDPTPPGEPVGAVHSAGDPPTVFRSVSRTADYDGEIAGGFTRAELMGARIIGPNGETIGTVSDLMIDENDRVEWVLVDVERRLGIGERPVALKIIDFTRNGDAFRTTMTAEDIKSQPTYRYNDVNDRFEPFEMEAPRGTR